MKLYVTVQHNHIHVKPKIITTFEYLFYLTCHGLDEEYVMVRCSIEISVLSTEQGN